MKRIVAYILALFTLLSLTACDGNDKDGGIKGDAYTARHAHLYYVVETFSNYDYSIVIDGTRAELTDTTYDIGETDDGAYTETRISRLTGTVTLEDGYYVITVKKLYNSVKLSGDGAKSHKDDMIAMAKEQIKVLDPGAENYKEYKERYETVIDLYNGDEIDATETTLSEFSSVKYKVKLDTGHGKITELIMFADGENMGGYKFEYDKNGNMIRSFEEDGIDGDVWETEYRENGTPSLLKYSDSDSGEVYAFSCDESGKLSVIAED